MKQKIFKAISLLSLMIAAGAVSGVSRSGMYQGQETKEVQSKMLFIISCITVLSVFSMISVNAADSYSYRQKGSAKSSVGTAVTYCTGTYYKTGATRWKAFWEAYSGSSSLKQASVASSKIKTATDENMTAEAKISMTTFDYRSGSEISTLKFINTGSSVVGG